MKMETWLKKNNMSQRGFCEWIGISRTTLWKACKGIPICPTRALLIEKYTDGKIRFKCKPTGRPKKIDISKLPRRRKT